MEALSRWARGPRGKAWGPVVVAAAVGLAVFWEVRAGFQARARGLSDPRYLVAARPLSAGLAVSFSDLKFRFADGAPIPAEAVTDQELHLLSDSVWARAVQEGEWITWAAMRAAPGGLGTSIPKGMRAHGLDFESGPAVFPKDRIDVQWRSQDTREATTLVEGALVLRVRREGAKQNVVVAVESDDIPVLEKAAGNGKLSLSVRNPDEAPQAAKRRRTSFGRGRIPGRRIEIWTEKA